MNHNNHNNPHPQVPPPHHYQQHQQQQQQHRSGKYSTNRNNGNVGGGGNGAGGNGHDGEGKVNHVLLLTVINPHYNINCDLVHQICSEHGKVNRIVIFRKNGVQAMVEFDSIESARRVKSALNGCDIFSGCCTLRIEYAKPARLNVHKNDNDSYDYVTPTSSNFNDVQAGDGNHHTGDGNQHTGNGDEADDAEQAVSSQGVHRSIPSDETNQNAGMTVDSQDNIGNQPITQHASSHQPRLHQQQHRGQLNSSNNNKMHMTHATPQNYHEADHQTNEANSQHATTTTTGYQSNIIKHSANPGPIPFQDGRLGGGPRGGGHHTLYPGSHDSGYPPTDTHSIHQHDAYSRQDDNHHHNSQSHHPARSSGINRGDVRRGRSMYPPNNHPGNNQPLFGGNPPRGTVMMVYGLPAERLNCDRLFNLFCLYGNVARIKFLRSKQGCAMVQMGDVAALDRCVGSLNRVSMFGADLQLSYSKQPFLHEVSQPFILPDDSPSFRDFINSKNNRFNNPDIASKNRILPPSHVLHFFNAPLGITEDELVHLFEQTAGHEPISIKIFTPKAENSKSLSGLAVFRDQIEATEALILCNHISVPKSDGPHPYILRLCFSPPNYPRTPYATQHDSHGQQQQSLP